MKATLNAAGHLLRIPRGEVPSPEMLRTAFFAVQRHIMEYGSAVQQKIEKEPLAWIGDKKPAQHCDPSIRSFIADLFPDARYFHLVRHPGAVVLSMQRAADKWPVVPAYWKAGPKAMLERWVVHEEQVDLAKESLGEAVLTLRYEDLLRDPTGQMRRCMAHLSLDMTAELSDGVEYMTRKENLDKQIGVDPQFHDPKLEAMMQRYGYAYDGTTQAIT